MVNILRSIAASGALTLALYFSYVAVFQAFRYGFYTNVIALAIASVVTLLIRYVWREQNAVKMVLFQDIIFGWVTVFMMFYVPGVVMSLISTGSLEPMLSNIVVYSAINLALSAGVALVTTASYRR